MTNLVFSDDYQLENIPDDFIGTYIPVQYDIILHTTRSHYKAMNSKNKNQYHDILLLNKNRCYSDAGFHDGYAIPTDQFKQYTFVTNNASKFLIDEKGYFFKTPELSIFFEGFSWYKKNHNFTQDNFSNDERWLLEKIIDLEKR